MATERLPMLFVSVDGFGDRVLERVQGTLHTNDRHGESADLTAFLTSDRLGAGESARVIVDEAGRLASKAARGPQAAGRAGSAAGMALLLVTLVADGAGPTAADAASRLLEGVWARVGTQLRAGLRLQIVLNTADFRSEADVSAAGARAKRLWQNIAGQALPARLYLVGRGTRGRILCDDLAAVEETTAFFLEALLLSDVWTGGLGRNRFLPEEQPALGAFQARRLCYPIEQVLEQLTRQGTAAVAAAAQSPGEGPGGGSPGFVWPGPVLPAPSPGVTEPDRASERGPALVLPLAHLYRTSHQLLRDLHRAAATFVIRFRAALAEMPRTLAEFRQRCERAAGRAVAENPARVESAATATSPKSNYVYRAHALWQAFAADLERTARPPATGWTALADIDPEPPLRDPYRRMALLIAARPNLAPVLTYIASFFAIALLIAGPFLLFVYGPAKGALWMVLGPVLYLGAVTLLILRGWHRADSGRKGFFAGAHDALNFARERTLRANLNALEGHHQARARSFLQWEAAESVRRAEALDRLLTLYRREVAADPKLASLPEPGPFERLPADSPEEFARIVKNLRLTDSDLVARVFSDPGLRLVRDPPARWLDAVERRVRAGYASALADDLFDRARDSLPQQVSHMLQDLEPMLPIERTTSLKQGTAPILRFVSCNARYRPVIEDALARAAGERPTCYDVAALNRVYIWTIASGFSIESVQFD